MRRLTFAIFLLGALALAQTRFTVTRQLVLAPTTIRDTRGHFVDGLTPNDLILYDNNIRQTVETDWSEYPVSQIVCVENAASTWAVLEKFNRTGVMLTDLMAGARGETAVLSYNDAVATRVNFTDDTNAVSHALLGIHANGDGANALDAIDAALNMFDTLPPNRRRIILMIGEKRDHGSAAALEDVMQRVESRNVVVYWLTYSTFLTPFTARPKVGDRETPEEQRRDWRHRDDLVPIPPPEPMNLLKALGVIGNITTADLSEVFTHATGGRTGSFLKKEALSDVLHVLSNEIHRQYILSFQPPSPDHQDFHKIRVEVANRPEVQITTRAGYWPTR